MSSLQKMLSEVRELDVSELDEVSGGMAPLTTTCYVDGDGEKHCVSNRDLDG